MKCLNHSGDLYLTHTKLDGKLTLRLCVGQTNTQERHVERAWRRIREEAEKVAALP
jgi:aromatic-L-amino-acid decarboxylase